MKKIISIICIISILFSMIALSAKAVIAPEDAISTRTQKLFVIAQARIDEITTPGSLVVDNFKEVFDFNGNSFIVFEYLPTGYAIFSEKSGAGSL